MSENITQTESGLFAVSLGAPEKSVRERREEIEERAQWATSVIQWLRSGVSSVHFGEHVLVELMQQDERAARAGK